MNESPAPRRSSAARVGRAVGCLIAAALMASATLTSAALVVLAWRFLVRTVKGE